MRLTGEGAGEAEGQDLAQVLVDPGTRLAGSLVVLTDADAMVLETGKRLLAGQANRCRRSTSSEAPLLDSLQFD